MYGLDYPMILDVGCGFSPEHTKRGNIGIDLKKGLCDIQGSMYNLPFRAKSFDKVIASHVLEHLQNFGLALREIHQVLKPEGTLEIDVPNPSCFWIFKDYVFSRKAKLGSEGISRDHICSFGESELQNLMQKTGFQTVSIEYCGTALSRKRLRESNLVHRLFYQLLFKAFPAFQHALHLSAKKGRLRVGYLKRPALTLSKI